MENSPRPANETNPSVDESLTGISISGFEEMNTIIRVSGLAEISTIEWGNRMHELRPGLFESYRSKDSEQSERLAEIRKGNADFNATKDWYFNLGSESDIFESTERDGGRSEQMRLYLIKAAQEVIKHTNAAEGTEFTIFKKGGAESIKSDKRILAANMLTEAARLAYEKDPENNLYHTHRLLEMSKSLLAKVFVNNADKYKQEDLSRPYAAEAILYYQDILDNELQIYNKVSAPEDSPFAKNRKKIQKNAKELNGYIKVINYAKETQNIGLASEAAVGLLIKKIISKNGIKDALFRKAYLREDVPFDSYQRNNIPKVAFDSVLETPEAVLPIQIKTNLPEYNEYKNGIGLVALQSLAEATGTTTNLNSVDNVYSGIINSYQATAAQNTNELNGYEREILDILKRSNIEL